MSSDGDNRSEKDFVDSGFWMKRDITGGLNINVERAWSGTVWYVYRAKLAASDASVSR